MQAYSSYTVTELCDSAAMCLTGGIHAMSDW